MFNAAGDPVPHALRTWTDQQSIEHGTATRPLFGIPRAAVQGLQLDDLTLTMTKTDMGSVLDLSATGAAVSSGADSPAGIAAYIVDLTGIERPVTALNFVLPPSTESFFCVYSIESSGDLSTWTTLVAKETLASTESSGARLLRTRAELPPTSGNYLRVHFGNLRVLRRVEQFFRTGTDVEYQNSPYSIPTNTSPKWSLYVDPNSSGLGQGMPELELEYSPHQLAFIAKAGEGPFTLAFGKYGERAPMMNWSAMTQAQPGQLATETVELGAIRDLAGSVALLAPEGEGRLKRYILWGVLLAGVGVLGGLSLRLARKMG